MRSSSVSVQAYLQSVSYGIMAALSFKGRSSQERGSAHFFPIGSEPQPMELWGETLRQEMKTKIQGALGMVLLF